MTVFAMDPGITKIGVSVVSDDGELLYYALHSPDKVPNYGVNAELIEQMNQLFREFTSLIEEHGVSRIVAELVPSFGKMGQQSRILAVQNMLRTIAIQRGLPYAEIAPRSVKKKFTGTAKADKEQMKSGVIERFPELQDVKTTYDVFDAIAIGLIGKSLPNNYFHEFGVKSND